MTNGRSPHSDLDPRVASPVGEEGGELGALVRALDWSTTPLGPMELWPRSLVTVVRLLLTSRFAMWMGWGKDLVFLYNDAYARMTLGEKHPWALGKPVSEVWSEIWDDIGPRISSVLETGAATWDEDLLLFLERSGFTEETYHTFSYSPVADDSGAIAGLFCVVTEETERVIGERRLASLRDLAAALTQAIAEEDVLAVSTRVLGTNTRDLPFSLIYALDDSGEGLTLVSRTGIPADHLAAPERIEASERDGLWPVDRILAGAPRVLVDLDSHFGSMPMGAWDRPPRQALLVPIAQPGQERPAGCLIVGTNPFRPVDDGYTGFVGLVAGQIASALANARAYEAERRRAEALAELDRAKTAFFSNVSHEFRTPLTLMLGPADDALHDPETVPRNRERIALIHRNALRLHKLVNSLLDFSRIEAGRVEAVYEPTDLAAFTAELASNFRSATEKAGLALIVEAPSMRDPAYVDRDMWEKVVLNLLSNAFKHTFDGSITVAVRERGEQVELEVRDTGVGIPADHLPRLFERFHRVPNARSRTHEGSGIGLALVQELVRLHGGEIAVESTEGVGTTFRVRLPLGHTHLPRERVGVARTRASTATSPQAYVEEAMRWLPEVGVGAEAPDSAALDGGLLEPGDVNPATAQARVLLADDNADMREYVQRLLRGQGWSVEAVPDGQAALEAARARRPDLVLSDIMMPGLDGFGLLRALRDDPRTHGVPVVLLSARAGEESRIEGLEAGADDYLVKPFSARELIARVSAHLSLSAARTRASLERERVLELERDARRRAEESERRFRETANAAPVLIWSADITGQFDWFNVPWLEFTGRAMDDELGRGWEEAVHPDDRNGLRATFDDALHAHRGFQLEFRLRRRDGEYRWLMDSGVPRFATDGTFLGYIGSAVDVTEQRASRERSERLQRLTAALAGTMTQPEVARVVIEAGIGATGASAASLLLADEACREIVMLTDSALPDQVRAEYRRVPWDAPTPGATTTRTGEPFFASNRAQALATFPSMAHTWEAMEMQAIAAVPVWSIGTRGAITLAYEAPREFSDDDRRFFIAFGEQCAQALERVRLAEADRVARAEAEAARTEAEAANRAKGDFLAAMSHELRTPLNAIAGYAQLLEIGVHGALNDAQRGAIERIQRSEQHLLSLINDVLNFAKIEAGRIEYELSSVVLSDAVATVAPMIEPQLSAKGLRYETRVAPDLVVYVDRDKLQQILLNLLSNAIKFTESGGLVSVTTDQRDDGADGYVFLRVSDTGIGIPREKQDAIFDPFIQVHRRLTSSTEGTGLGLAISRDLARNMGGDLRVRSAEGQGSTFTLMLPRATSNA